MKRVVAVVLIVMLMLPGMAWAGSSTDAALGLGAFAALGTLLLGAAVLSHPAVAAPAPAVVELPAPPVVYAPPPPPPVVYAPAPRVIYAPPPPPPVVYYAPAPPVVYGPPPVAYAPVYGYRGHGRYGYAHHWRRY
jgi:hypothetical protein